MLDISCWLLVVSCPNIWLVRLVYPRPLSNFEILRRSRSSIGGLRSSRPQAFDTLGWVIQFNPSIRMCVYIYPSCMYSIYKIYEDISRYSIYIYTSGQLITGLSISNWNRIHGLAGSKLASSCLCTEDTDGDLWGTRMVISVILNTLR